MSVRNNIGAALDEHQYPELANTRALVRIKQARAKAEGYDIITKPRHYNWHPSGVECKEVCDDLPRWIGDAISYIWRRNHKGQPVNDRRKAIERLGEATPDRWEWLATKGVPIQTSDAMERFLNYPPSDAMDGTLDLAVWLVRTALFDHARHATRVKDALVECLTEELNKMEEN